MWNSACQSLSARDAWFRTRARLSVMACVAVLVAFGTGVHATSIPPDPRPSDVSGTWLAIRQSGDVCRLDVDAERGSGELVCTIGGGLFRTAIQAVVLDHVNLAITLENKESLNGEVVYDRFAAAYGTKQISFVKLSRLKTALTQLGGDLSIGSLPRK